MARKKRFSGDGHAHLDEALINLTPLIDVVFVVLIAFILIAPLLEVDHVSLAQSTITSEKDLPHDLPIAVYVKEDNSLWINHKCVTEDELVQVLKKKKEEMPEVIPQLFHDQKASFGTYQKVKNCIEMAGFLQMDVIVKS
jgi:biopolymer transport protein ExbD